MREPLQPIGCLMVVVVDVCLQLLRFWAEVLTPAQQTGGPWASPCGPWWRPGEPMKSNIDDASSPTSCPLSSGAAPGVERPSSTGPNRTAEPGLAPAHHDTLLIRTVPDSRGRPSS
ncbi:unnamed protein product [Gadus morhua 'NCC']